MNGGRRRSGQFTNNYHIIFLSRDSAVSAVGQRTTTLTSNCNGALFRRAGEKSRGAETTVVSWAGIGDCVSLLVSAVRCGAVLGRAGRRAGGAVQLPRLPRSSVQPAQPPSLLLDRSSLVAGLEAGGCGEQLAWYQVNICCPPAMGG